MSAEEEREESLEEGEFSGCSRTGFIHFCRTFLSRVWGLCRGAGVYKHLYVQEACSRDVPSKTLGLLDYGGPLVPGLSLLVSGCVSRWEDRRWVWRGECCWPPLFTTLGLFPALGTSAFFSSLLFSPARPACRL